VTLDEIIHEANSLSIEDLEELAEFCNTLVNCLLTEEE
jgi:hypothetical protein